MKLITWNIQWGPGADGRVDLDRIVAHAQRFADFDVLCVQEVSAGHHQVPDCDGSGKSEQLVARLPGYELVAGMASDVLGAAGRRRRFANMPVSRLPAQQVFRHLLRWPAEDGVMGMQRVAIEATLDPPLGLLRVTTTHLEYYSPRQRRVQIDRLRKSHREAVAHARVVRPGTASDGDLEPVPRAAAAALGGDFNFKPDDPDHTRLLAPMAWTHRATAMRGNLPNLAAHTSRRSARTTRNNGQAGPSPLTSSASGQNIAGRWSRVAGRGSRARCAPRRIHRCVADHQPMLLELD